MPSPFSCGPVIRECSRMETQIEKEILKSASVWSHPRIGNLNEAQRVSVKIYLHKYCGFSQSTGKISWSLSEGFAPSCFRKTLIWKVLQKIHPEGTIIEILSSVTHNLQLHWKRTAPQLFSYDFWKDFSEYCFVSEHWYSNRRNWSIRPHMF